MTYELGSLSQEVVSAGRCSRRANVRSLRHPGDHIPNEVVIEGLRFVRFVFLVFNALTID